MIVKAKNQLVLPKCIPKWAGLALSLGLFCKIVNVKMTTKVIKKISAKSSQRLKSLCSKFPHAKRKLEIAGTE